MNRQSVAEVLTVIKKTPLVFNFGRASNDDAIMRTKTPSELAGLGGGDLATLYARKPSMFGG